MPDPNGKESEAITAPPASAMIGAKEGRPPLPWVIVGSIFACGVLAVLAYLVVRPTPIPCNNRPLVVPFFALGCACATAFLGGYAAYKGSIPNVGVVSFGGGAAVLVVLLLVGQKLMPGGCTDPAKLVWGSVVGLKDEDAVKDRVWSTKLRDLDTYERTGTSDNGSFEFEWMIRFIGSAIPVRFQLDHRYKTTVAPDPFQFLSLPQAAAPARQPEVLSLYRYFTLPDDQSPVLLEYYPPEGSDLQKIGKLFRRGATGSVEIPLETEPHAAKPHAFAAPPILRLQPVFAAEPDPQQNPAAQMYIARDAPCAPSATPQQRDRFLDRLGGSNLSDQVEAREQLVAGGAACFPLMTDALKDPSSTLKRQRGVLISNLTAAADAIAARGVQVPGALWGQIASWQYKLSQFDEASEHFNRIDAATYDKDPSLLFFDGYCKMKQGKFDEALARYNQYRQKDPQAAESSATFHGNLGSVLFSIARRADTASKTEEALKLYAQSQAELSRAISMVQPGYANSPAAHLLTLQLDTAKIAERNAKLKMQMKQSK